MKHKKLIRNVIISVSVFLLLFTGVTVFGARLAPKYDKGNSGDGIFNYTGAGIVGIYSGIRSSFEKASNSLQGKDYDWGKHYKKYNNEAPNILGSAKVFHQADERGEYKRTFDKFTKNVIPMTESLNKNGQYVFDVGDDQKLSKSQNSKIKKAFNDEYNSWLKKNQNPSTTEARYEAMKAMEKAYEKVLGKNNPRTKEIEGKLSKLKNELKNNNKTLDKDANKSDSEPQTLSGKIAKALLDMFYTSGIGDWMAKSGPGASIFALSYKPGTAASDVYSQLASNLNSDIYSQVFPNTADTKSLKDIRSWMGPLFMSLAGVLIVMVVIVQGAEMGWGQAFNPYQSRLKWYNNMMDTFIAVIGCVSYSFVVKTLLTINGGILVGLANFMATTKAASNYNILTEAMTIGFSQDTINMLTSGNFIGSEFSGIIFSIIYLMTYLGLAVYLKYFYFVREIVFIILWVIGPIFIALWPTIWGKVHTVNWFKEFTGTIFIQSVHALTITFMATLMAWNNQNFAKMAQDITEKSAGQAASDSFGAVGSAVGSWNLIGAGGLIIQGAAQAVGLKSPGVIVKNAAQHFETMVIGFIIMILFQPLSRALADLFGVENNMLDSIHNATSGTLKSGAMIAGGAIVGGAALGIAATGTGAATALTGAKAAGAGLNAAKNLTGKNKLDAFKKGFGKQFANSDSVLNRFRDKGAKTMARFNGIVGKSLGQTAANTFAKNAGMDPSAVFALTRAGGEIGDRAASLTATPLSKLGLKAADPNRRQKEALRNNINDATRRAATKNTTATMDKAAGIEEQLKRAKSDPELSANQDRQEAIREAEKNIEFANNAGLSDSKAAAARARRLTDGKNNYKDAQALNNAYRKKIMASALSPDQKKAALQVGDKALVTAGLPAYDPNIMFDNKGYADAQRASEQAKAVKEAQIKSAFESNKIPGAPTSDQMSFKEWQNTAQYQSEFAPQVSNAGKVAAQTALNESNGHVYGNIDDTLFQKGIDSNPGTIVNSDIFKHEVSQGLKSQGISESQAENFASTANGISGQSLTQSVPILDGEGGSAQIIDSGLWNKINNQQAEAVNASWGGDPVVSSADLNTIYTGAGQNIYGGLIGNDSGPVTADDITNFVGKQNRAADYTQGQANWAQFHNMTQATADRYDMTNPLTWFTNPSQNNWEGVYGDQSLQSNLSQASHGYPRLSNWDRTAQKRITSNPNLQPNTTGMSLSSAYSILPKTMSQNGADVGIDPGSFRMQVQNTHSLLQARDSEGIWHDVGNIGPGDGTLSAGDTVYQDLDLSSNGTPSLHYDNASHSVSTPYTLDGNTKSPASLVNGIPELGDFFTNPSFNANSQRDLGDFMHMAPSSILQKAVGVDRNPTLDQYTQSYSDFALQGNNSSYTITGINSITGQRENLTMLSKNAPELEGMPANTSYYIPLHNNGETGLDIDTANSNSQIFFNGNVKHSDRKLASSVFENFLDDPKRIDRVNNYLHESLLPYTRSYTRNFISNNPAMLDGTNLDTFYKGIY